MNNSKLIILVIFLFIVAFITGIFWGYCDFQKNETLNNKNEIVQNTNSTSRVDITSENNEAVLKNTNGKDFYNILCAVAEITPAENIVDGNTISYKSENDNYRFEIKTTISNEITKIKMEVIGNVDYDNFLIASTRLDYNGSDKANLLNWILENKEKDISTKIGDANFKFSLGENNKPILEIYP